MTEQRPPSITYEQFIHEVRRFNTADLVAAIAALDPKWSEVGSGPEQWVVMSPWGLAAIARESLLHGNVHRRSRPIGETDIRRLHALFANTYGRREDELRDSSLEIVTRHVHEQFPFQESDFEELTRTVAVLGSHAIGEAGASLASVDVDALLGAPIEAGVGAAIAIWSICQAHHGRWADVLEDMQMVEVFDGLDPGVVRHVRNSMTTGIDGFKASYASVPEPTSAHLRRWSFNPLGRYPLVAMPDGTVVAPQPRYILRRVTLGSLYYVGLEQHGTAFSRAMGPVIEGYVGRQLALIDGARVEPEITWGTPEQKSVDWFLVLPDCVVLVEVKATRLTLGARSGDVDLIEKLQQSLDKARGQIDRSAKQVREGNVAFGVIPTDRPLIGLIVTAEPVYMANTPWVEDLLRSMEVPTRIASLRDLEGLTPQSGADLGRALLQVLDDEERRSSLWPSAMAGLIEHIRNPILDQAADQIPMLGNSGAGTPAPNGEEPAPPS